MVFQKPYLNIACKRSAQRAIPWWEHTKLSTKLIRVILRQPKKSKKEKKKSLPCPVLQEQMSLVWTSLSVQPRHSGRWFLGKAPHSTNVEGGWGAQCGCIKEYSSLGNRMTLSARGPAGSRYLSSSVAVNSILLTQKQNHFLEKECPCKQYPWHRPRLLGKKWMLPKVDWKENSLLEVVTPEILH